MRFQDAKAIPRRRIAEAEEMAECVLFLASDTAADVTGIALDVKRGRVDGVKTLPRPARRREDP